MITANFDFNSGWSFNGEPEAIFGISFSNGEMERFCPSGFSFGWKTQINGVKSNPYSWPPENAQVRELSSKKVFYFSLDALGGEEVVLKVWVVSFETNSESEISFVVPLPPSPYPSWLWKNGDWVAPVPRPDGNGPYLWDEEKQEWYYDGIPLEERPVVAEF